MIVIVIAEIIVLYFNIKIIVVFLNPSDPSTNIEHATKVKTWENLRKSPLLYFNHNVAKTLLICIPPMVLDVSYLKKSVFDYNF